MLIQLGMTHQEILKSVKEKFVNEAESIYGAIYGGNIVEERLAIYGGNIVEERLAIYGGNIVEERLAIYGGNIVEERLAIYGSGGEVSHIWEWRRG